MQGIRISKLNLVIVDYSIIIESSFIKVGIQLGFITQICTTLYSIKMYCKGIAIQLGYIAQECVLVLL